VRTYRVEVAIFAIAFTVFGLVALALVWSGDWAYSSLATINGVKGASFRSYGPCTFAPPSDCFVEGPISLEALLSWHRAWSAYVTGVSSQAPVTFGRSTFTTGEYEHMADVRAVFRGAEYGAALALFVLVFRVQRARRRGDALRLVRSGALTAAGIVTLIGVAAAVAFDPLFLLFHEVFFPQGNFLFDPETSNLIRLYPEWYWQGVTASVGLSFITVSLLAAWVAHKALRKRSNTYTRAA
jgi:integral membrane protein (TIGR01906 family)